MTLDRHSRADEPGYAAYRASPASTEGTMSRRVFAYLIDFVVIAILVALLGILVGIVGLITFGLGWALYAILWPATAILYSAVAVGGPSMGTVGMRMLGLRAADAETGGRVGLMVAGVHALLFYVGIGTILLLVLDVLIGFARADGRLGHDLLAGLIVLRR